MIEKIFTYKDYLTLKDKIQNKELFEHKASNKKVRFVLSCRREKESVFKENLVCSFGVRYDTSGFSVPFHHDEMPSYEEICERGNSWLDYILALRNETL